MGNRPDRENVIDDVCQTVNIIGFVDNDKSKQVQPFYGYSVYSPLDAVTTTDFDYILIAVAL
jgi:hypothetical protein